MDIEHLFYSFMIRTPKLWSDSFYLKVMYKIRMETKLNLRKPKTFCEKLQWLKLYNRMPEYTIMVDKVKAKEYVASIIGEKYIIPTLGVWDNPNDIDFDALPNKFVLKCNHNSGTGMYICRDKNKMDIEKVKTGLMKGLKEDYFALNREWPYKNVPRRILAEKLIEDFGEQIQYPINHKGEEPLEVLTDYKFFCFNGEPYMMYVSQDHAQHARTDFFDMDFKRLPIRMKDPNSDLPIPKPEKFDEMRCLARKLSQGVPCLRVDFYMANHQVYFGELTFFHNSGFTSIQPEEWNLKIGEMIILPS